MTSIEEVVSFQRLDSFVAVISTLLYSPIGIVLVVLRGFLTLNFICSQIVFNFFCNHNNTIRRNFERLFICLLGFIGIQKNFNFLDKKALLISNYTSNIDSYILSFFCNSKNVRLWKGSHFLKTHLRLACSSLNASERSKVIKQYHDAGNSLLIFPEPGPTTGKGLMKFSEWVFLLEFPVQPVIIKTKRPHKIAMTTVESSWWHDLLWSYFCLFTVYEVVVLPSMMKNPTESAAEFIQRVRTVMSTNMGAADTNFDASDVKDRLKKIKFEARRPQEHRSIYGGSVPASPGISRMANQVQSILPDVPISIIISDIERTKSVDVTVANILEGVVKYTPISNPSKATSSKQSATPSSTPTGFSKNPDLRHSSLQEKKQAFIAEARKKYLKKRNIS